MGQKQSKLTNQDKAIFQLKLSRDNLNKFTRNTNNLIENERANLKSAIRQDISNGKDYKANVNIRILLKRIHYQEILLSKANDQLINLENMLSNIEFKLIEKDFIKGVDTGNKILTKLNKELNIDYVNDVMDTLEDQMSYEREVDQVLNSNILRIGNTGNIAISLDDEIDKELDQMLGEQKLSQQDVDESKIVEDKLPSVEHLPLPAAKVQPEKEKETETQREMPLTN
ncbi:related to Vacuolar protein sorting-associated protein 20 [Saccharomycodes ludwigii]|uniref:Related to Vacuolar protein sorting-associated protein 20 n=1 Tax=Saccharomycodes ludwigii TaxID=36035 RepID=A0A376B1K6_9ASCO|nr:hypothetical protein SCDLUD_001448 [Saccharomycodes ludwigii]KAH3901677.1 hypothetical protein SCDLUD_001448 [Saccharomycodes ludwigii]SSD58568.1 related to Vacuolar protein sorting-associated protein 20 [Saccharomycodes ludwigii]